MTTSRSDLELRILAQDEATKVFASLQKQTQGFGSTLSSVSKIATGFLAANVLSQATSKLSGFFSESIKQASDLSESMNAVNVVFGQSSQKILEWGKNAATQAGLSQAAFNQLSTPLGAMLKNSGMSMDEVADKTIALTQRAADMASVFNTDVTDALTAIQAAIRGEADPIEKYGVSITAAKVEAEAMAVTGKKVAASLTDQEKAAARLRLIFKQTDQVQGDFVRTGGEQANAQRIQQAQQEELQAQIGQYLLPLQLKWTQAKAAFVSLLATQVVPTVEKYANIIATKLRPELDKIVAAVQPWVEQFRSSKEAMTAAGIAIGTILVGAFAALAISAGAAAIGVIAAMAPVIALTAAVGGLGAGIYLLNHHWDELTAKYPALATASENARIAFTTAWATIREAVAEAVLHIRDRIGALKPVWQFLEDDVQTRVKGVIGVIESIWTAISSIVAAVKALADGDWKTAWEEFKKAGKAVVEGVISAIEAWFGELPNKLLAIGREAGSALLKGIGEIAGGALDKIGLGGLVGRASGGPVNPHQPYIVGERGPELFVPTGAGRIIPTSGIALARAGAFGGANVQVVNITVQGSIIAERDVARLMRRAGFTGAIPELA